MWHVATKKHEAFRHAILKSLTHLAGKCLTIAEIRWLFIKIRGMANKDHDRSSLNLLKSLAKRVAPVKSVDKVLFEFNNLAAINKTSNRRPRSFSETREQSD